MNSFETLWSYGTRKGKNMLPGYFRPLSFTPSGIHYRLVPICFCFFIASICLSTYVCFRIPYRMALHVLKPTNTANANFSSLFSSWKNKLARNVCPLKSSSSTRAC